VLLIRGKVSDESRNPINRWMTAAYTPVVRFVFEHRWKVVVAAVLTMVLTAAISLSPTEAELRKEDEFIERLTSNYSGHSGRGSGDL